MSVEEEKEVNQNEGVRGLLREDHKAELGKILAFGEKYKIEGEKMGGRFWETVCDDDDHWYDRDRYVNLLAQYDENRKLIEEGLLEEEKQVLNELTDIARDKFYDKYLYDKIVYSGNPDGYGETRVKYGGDFSKEDLMSWIKSLKDSLKPGVSVGLGGGAYNPPGEYCKWMGDEGVKMVAKELKDSLQPGMRIFLNWNKIGAEGAKAMARDWKGKLQPGMDINLLCNRIGNEGIKALVEEWKDSLKSGMHINLGSNEIGDEGVKAMAEEWKDSLQPGMKLLLGHSCDKNVGKELKEWEQSYKERGINCEVNV